MISIINCLYYVMAISSGLGFLFLLRKKKRLIFVFLVSFIGFGILWRHFSSAHSHRYYSFFIVIGLCLTTYAIDCTLTFAKHYNTLKTFTAIIITTVLLVHILKLFLSFNNVYIIDLQNRTNEILLRDPNASICIYNKDFGRIADGLEDSDNQLNIIPSSSFNLLNYCIKKKLIWRNTFYFVEEKNEEICISLKKRMVKDYFRVRIIGHFLTSSKHNKAINIYSMPQFNPFPVDVADSSPYNLVLKSYIPEFDAFIYHDPQKNKLIWVIGYNLDEKTEIIFHLHTNKKNLLPESRIQYGFDNRGFKCGDKCEKEQFNHYRVFEKDIPLEYPITYIRWGFNTKGKTFIRDFSI